MVCCREIGSALMEKGKKMVDYISRQKAIEAIMDLPNCPNGYSDTYDKECIIGTIEEVPTADVVEVVRCKDCKHSIEDKLFGGLWCQHLTEKHCERNADFYCGSGERREE